MKISKSRDNENIETESTVKKEKKNKKEKSKSKNKETLRWFLIVVIITFLLSLLFSYISTTSINGINLASGILVLALVIFIGIIFDIIAVSITIAPEHEFHAKASKKIKGARTSLKLIKHSAKVANICADVVGDVCGVLSGAISAIITIKIASEFNLTIDLQFILSAIVASLTVGGKAVGKIIAQNNSTRIIHTVGKIISVFGTEKNK